MARNKFAVIGLGQFGSAIARYLTQRGAEVVAIDVDEDKVEAIKEEVAYSVTLDSTDVKALESQKVRDMDAVVVAIGASFQDLLLTTFVLQELGVKRIMARAQGPVQRGILEKMGIREILSPEDEVAHNVTTTLINPSVLMSLQFPDDYEIVEVVAPANIQNRTLDDIGLREKYQLNLVTLLRKEDGAYHIVGVPDGQTMIHTDDLVVVFGQRKSIDRFIQINQ